MRSKERGAVLTLFATMVVIATTAHARQNTRNFLQQSWSICGHCPHAWQRHDLHR